eukprot:m51a1_g9281 hypothetical protein (338) ;mRNA; r:125254-126574
MKTALATCLSFTSLCLAAQISLVLPAGLAPAAVTNTSGPVTPAAVGNALAALSMAAANTTTALPVYTSYPAISAAPIASHVLVFDGVSASVALSLLPLTSAAVSGRHTLEATCASVNGSCFVAAVGTPLRVTDRIAHYAQANLTLSTVLGDVAVAMAPRYVNAAVAPAAATSVLVSQCGAQQADVTELAAVNSAAAAELARACSLAADNATATQPAFTLVALSTVADILGLSGSAQQAGINVADAVIAKYLTASRPRATVSLLFFSERAPTPADRTPNPRAPLITTPSHPHTGNRQILIWLPVVLFCIVVAGSFVMFAVGIDAEKDTLLYRTTATFH